MQQYWFIDMGPKKQTSFNWILREGLTRILDINVFLKKLTAYYILGSQQSTERPKTLVCGIVQGSLPLNGLMNCLSM